MFIWSLNKIYYKYWTYDMSVPITIAYWIFNLLLKELSNQV